MQITKRLSHTFFLYKKQQNIYHFEFILKLLLFYLKYILFLHI